MQNQTFGIIAISLFSFVFLLGTGSIIASCFFDPKETTQKNIKPLAKRNEIEEFEDETEAELELVTFKSKDTKDTNDNPYFDFDFGSLKKL